jgi:LPXTG-site transpeptidase (sortase) family protein
MINGILRWLERLLLIVGVVLAVWVAWVVIDSRRVQMMPIPPPSPPGATTTARTARRLPDDGTSAPVAAKPGSWLARLEMPSVKLTATVLEGSDDRTLRHAAGHLEDTPLPGQRGNIGIAGHRDGIFRPLKDAHVGDTLTLTTSGFAYRYRISRTLIVAPEDVYVLDPTLDPTLTLVTCYPFNFIGHAPKRFIVQAELVDQQARAAR